MAFTSATLKTWLSIDRVDAQLDAQLDDIVAAVAALIDQLPNVDRVADVNDPAVMVWAPSTELAAKLLGARLYRRRNSPSGVEAFGTDGATYVARHDPDVARLLHLDRFEKPMVG